MEFHEPSRSSMSLHKLECSSRSLHNLNAVPGACMQFHELVCSSLSFHKVLSACMQFPRLSLSEQELTRNSQCPFKGSFSTFLAPTGAQDEGMLALRRASKEASKQASTWSAFSRSHALEGLVFKKKNSASLIINLFTSLHFTLFTIFSF